MLNPTGHITGAPVARPTDQTTGGSDAFRLALAAAQAYDSGRVGVAVNVSEAQAFAAVVAAAYARGGGDYDLAYRAAYLADLAAAQQAVADFNGGYYPHITNDGGLPYGTQDPWGFITAGVPGSSLHSDVAVSLSLPDVERAVGSGDFSGLPDLSGFSLSQLTGLFLTAGQQEQQTQQDQQTNQATARRAAAAGRSTLADQMASPPGAPPKPGAGVPRPLRRQMRRVG